MLSGHRLPIIEMCLKALADCQTAEARTTVISPHFQRMNPEQLSDYTKHDLARSLAALLVEDIKITEGVMWSDEPGREGQELDMYFTARTVVMTPSTYNTLCQALRRLQADALDERYSVIP